MKLTVSLLGVLLIIVAVASSSAEDDEQSHPGEGLDATGNPTNRTDLTRMSEDKTFISIKSSINERGVCEITKSCKAAGGFCVKKKKDCSGAVDKQTCLGRKCMCCMPDVVKGCSPTLSCSSAKGYCVTKDKDCYSGSGVTDPSGCVGKRCKCCLPPVSTTIVTTETTSTTTEMWGGDGGTDDCGSGYTWW